MLGIRGSDDVDAGQVIDVTEDVAVLHVNQPIRMTRTRAGEVQFEQDFQVSGQEELLARDLFHRSLTENLRDRDESAAGACIAQSMAHHKFEF